MHGGMQAGPSQNSIRTRSSVSFPREAEEAQREGKGKKIEGKEEEGRMGKGGDEG